MKERKTNLPREKYPKLFWKELQSKKVQTENNIIASKWFDYVRQLYEQDPKVEPPPLVNTDIELFMLQEVDMGIKKLGVGKAKDLVKLQAEYLKWDLKILAPHITKNFNNIIQHGFPTNWTRLAIPIFKSDDVNNPSNYRTIMITPCLQIYLEACWKIKLASGQKKEINVLKGKQVLGLNIPQSIIVDRKSVV